MNKKALLEVPRQKSVQLDECFLASRLIGNPSPSPIMIDVGAHFGGSARHVVDRGWQIYCFEPDADNREKLAAKFGNRSNLIIDARAVSDRPASNVDFFTSDESTGISALHAFTGGHSKSDTVEVTTIEEIIAEHEIEHIDFLKIDVEGFDFSVLKGVPWDKIKPGAILCEFEDSKTLRLGHSYRNICDFLVGLGYAVYLSEWYPVVRYGIKHDWHQVMKYPAALKDPDAWGNILAFQKDPGSEAIQQIFLESVNREAGQTASRSDGKTKKKPKVASQPDANAHSSDSFVRRMAKATKSRSLVVFHIGQFAMWCIRALRRRFWGLGGLALLAILLPLVFAFTDGGAR